MHARGHALWTALVTPLLPDFSLDIEGFEHLIAEQERARLGLLLLGSTAESLNLSLDVKRQILLLAFKKKLSVPVMVGVQGHDLAATTSWLDYLETLPVDAYLMITPIYARPSDEGQYHWFKTLLDRASRPVMLYNVPKRTGTSLSLNAVERLASHKNFWGIKEASGSVESFREYVRASGGRPVYCGDDALFPAFADAGSSGLISVASNVWPLATTIVVEQCLAHRFVDNAVWHEACEQLFKAVNPTAVKRVLFEHGRIASATMMPPLSALDFASCDALLAADCAITTWTKRFV